jgi:type IV pilus biogenesis protein CpaD/CtpE
VAKDCRAVATRIDRRADQFIASGDRSLLGEAARLLRGLADEYQQRSR